ncbi:hypothetical protein [Hugenholtzia roseola]|uniref:hypothetical protein n=1 Tax=Hugenholtzia roseola TaxID=1002 RepID=UPI00042A4E69|nr:hypothetical protein [Hugenholtzia roseola]
MRPVSFKNRVTNVGTRHCLVSSEIESKTFYDIKNKAGENNFITSDSSCGYELERRSWSFALQKNVV